MTSLVRANLAKDFVVAKTRHGRVAHGMVADLVTIRDHALDPALMVACPAAGHKEGGMDAVSLQRVQKVIGINFPIKQSKVKAIILSSRS